MKMETDPNFILFSPSSFLERFYRKIRENRITHPATVELLAKKVESWIVVFEIANKQRLIYIFGRRIK